MLLRQSKSVVRACDLLFRRRERFADRETLPVVVLCPFPLALAPRQVRQVERRLAGGKAARNFAAQNLERVLIGFFRQRALSPVLLQFAQRFPDLCDRKRVHRLRFERLQHAPVLLFCLVKLLEVFERLCQIRQRLRPVHRSRRDSLQNPD